MKWVVSAVSIFAAVIMFIFAFVLFDSSIGETPINREYGGDAYTGIQNATAATARNVVYTNKLMRRGFGAISLIAGFAFLIVSICFFDKAKKDTASAVPKTVNPTYPPAASQSMAPPKPIVPQASIPRKDPRAFSTEDYWVCKACSTKNQKDRTVCWCCDSVKDEDEDEDWMDVDCPHCGEKLSFLKGTTLGLCPNCDHPFNIG